MNRYVYAIAIAMLVAPADRLVAEERFTWNAPGDDETVSVILIGDTNIQNRARPESAFDTVRHAIDGADIRFLNLEGPFAGPSAQPQRSDMGHKEWRYSDASQVAALTEAGIDVVGTANNVTYPWQAAMRSLAVLRDAGIRQTGSGIDIDAAHVPAIIERQGVRLGFLQYAATVFPTNHAATANQPGIAQIKVHTAYEPPPNLDKPATPAVVVTWLNGESSSRMRQGISRLKQEVDIVIASYHWGLSSVADVQDYQRDVAQLAVDAGADLVFGHGTHTFQSIEFYRRTPIIYGAGQGLFDDQTKRDRAKRFRPGLLVRAGFTSAGLKSLSAVPTWRHDPLVLEVAPVDTDTGRALFDELQSLTGPEQARLQIEGGVIRILPPAAVSKPSQAPAAAH